MSRWPAPKPDQRGKWHRFWWHRQRTAKATRAGKARYVVYSLPLSAPAQNPLAVVDDRNPRDGAGAVNL